MHCRQGLHAFLRAYYHYKSADWPGNQPLRLNGWSGRNWRECRRITSWTGTGPWRDGRRRDAFASGDRGLRLAAGSRTACLQRRIRAHGFSGRTAVVQMPHQGVGLANCRYSMAGRSISIYVCCRRHRLGNLPDPRGLGDHATRCMLTNERLSCAGWGGTLGSARATGASHTAVAGIFGRMKAPTASSDARDAKTIEVKQNGKRTNFTLGRNVLDPGVYLAFVWICLA